MHVEHYTVPGSPDGEPDRASVRMPGDVGQRFLGNSEESRRTCSVQGCRAETRRDPAADSRARLKFGGLPFERRRQT